MSDTECPKCGRDICTEYEEYVDHKYDDTCKASKYIKIDNYRSYFDGEYSGYTWDVKCICPRCKKRFYFSDSDV